ncbi:MAG: Hpt domain-containing protein [Defluviitaleaceae bacterium]|nr:Hpt domain-containing protein [Defluviitaleaceae bacterium]
MGNYAAYLPHINAEEGIKRIMNNKKLYISMLTRFKLQEMTDALLESVASGDHEKIIFAAHALKGAAGNLGLPTLQDLTGIMEQSAKEKNDVAHLLPDLRALVGEITLLIEAFIRDEV